jgi:hypothetical protein
MGKYVGGVVLYAVRVVLKESRRLLLPRTSCYLNIVKIKCDKGEWKTRKNKTECDFVRTYDVNETDEVNEMYWEQYYCCVKKNKGKGCIWCTGRSFSTPHAQLDINWTKRRWTYKCMIPEAYPSLRTKEIGTERTWNSKYCFTGHTQEPCRIL